jgi:hypothetical protein
MNTTKMRYTGKDKAFGRCFYQDGGTIFKGDQGDAETVADVAITKSRLGSGQQQDFSDWRPSTNVEDARNLVRGKAEIVDTGDVGKAARQLR